MRKLTIKEFIKKSRQKHGRKYNYAKAVYEGKDKKLIITCPVHGDFMQNAGNHMRGQGCPECKKRKIGDALRSSKKNFIEKAKKIHGSKYQYKNVVYVNAFTKVSITCKSHGDFMQIPNSHLKGRGCPICGLEKNHKAVSFTFDIFVGRAQQVHGKKYGYIKKSFISLGQKTQIICPKHGIFEQRGSDHLNGQGCPQCRYEVTSEKNTLDDGVVKKRLIEANKSFGYDISEVNYTAMRDKIKLTCKKHGSFFVEAQKFLYRGQGCPSCATTSSKAENEIADFIASLGFTVKRRDRSIISPMELDIVIPEKKIAIEYNGIYFHTEKFGKDKWYHRKKTDACESAGYRLIHIFEDTFRERKDIILSFIRHLFGKSEQKSIYARKCEIREVTHHAASLFLDRYHVQGRAVRAFKHIGLYHDNMLVSVTSFTRGQSNTRNKGSFELIRHATNGNVVGALGKAVKYFSRTYSHKVFTYCDTCLFTGESYIKAGFVQDGEIPPDYTYVIGQNREHKFKWRLKDIEEIYGIKGMSERQAMESLGFWRVYDCGKRRYILPAV